MLLTDVLGSGSMAALGFCGLNWQAVKNTNKIKVNICRIKGFAVRQGIVYYQYFKHFIKPARMKLLQSLKSILKVGHSDQPLTESEKKELNHAVVELMLEMVRADFVELHTEKTALIALLSDSLELHPEEVVEYIEKAEIRADFSLSIKSQTNVINNYLTHAEKAALLANMWQLAYADDELHLLESKLIEQASQLMGFSQQELQSLCQNS